MRNAVTAVLVALAVTVSLAVAVPARADPQPFGPGTLAEAIERLRPGEYLWAPQIAPDGPVTVVVNRRTQRAIVYRSGLPIGITTISTGRPGHTTPLGTYRVLLRAVAHTSSIYRGAPMPYMQRITTGGIALHGGELPGYPASHGCIRLPVAFARLLFGVTGIGTSVRIVDEPALALLLVAADEVRSEAALGPHLAPGPARWRDDAGGTGALTLFVSAHHRRVLVLRQGVLIGSGPASPPQLPVALTAYRLQPAGWEPVPIPGNTPAAPADDILSQLGLDPALLRHLDPMLRTGATIVMAGDRPAH